MSKVINLDNYNSYSGADVVVTAQMVGVNGGKSTSHTLGSLQTISYSTHQDKVPVRAIGNINAIDYVMGQRTVAGTLVFTMFDEHWMTPFLDDLKGTNNGEILWSDELPAMNLTISAANEYGYKSSMVIYGVKFIDDGGVMSINDLYTENTLQFVATGIEPFSKNGYKQHQYTVNTTYGKIDSKNYTPSVKKEFNIDNSKASASIPKVIGEYDMLPVDNDKKAPGSVKYNPTNKDYTEDDVVITTNRNQNNNLINIYIPEKYDVDNIFITDINKNKDYIHNIYEPNDNSNKNIYNIYSPNDGNNNIVTNTYMPSTSSDDNGVYSYYLPYNTNINDKYNYYSPDDYRNVANDLYDSKNLYTNRVLHTFNLIDGEYVIGLQLKDGTIISSNSLIIGNKEATDSYISGTPVLNDLKNNSITFFANNAKSDTVKLQSYDIQSFIDQDNQLNSIRYNGEASYTHLDNPNKEKTLNGLSYNTKYELSTVNSEINSESNKLIFETPKNEKETINLFKEFVQNNQNLHVNKSVTDFDYNTLNAENNIIDSVLDISDYDTKTEMMLYAIKFYNQLLKVNNENEYSNMVFNNEYRPLDCKFTYGDNVKKINIYKCNKDSKFFITAITPSDEYVFYGQNNVKYYVQPVLNNNKKGCYNYFYCFNEEDKEKLYNYLNVNNLRNKTMINNKNFYSSLNNELYNAVVAKDNIKNYNKFLDEPSVYLNEYIMYVDLDYSEKINDDDTYYFTIANYKEALDNTPLRKFAFDNKTKKLELNNNKIRLYKNDYYLLWIEDKNFNIISEVGILSTYDNDTNLEFYYDNLIQEKLNQYKTIAKKYSESLYDIINDAVNTLSSYNNLHMKDLDYQLLQKNYMYISQNSTADNDMFNIFSVLCNEYNENYSAILNEDLIMFNITNAVLCSITIDNLGIKKEKIDTFIYDIKSNNEGYTFLFLLDKKYNTKNNFIMINNQTSSIYCYNIRLEGK